MSRAALCLISCLAVTLSACGFRPLYGESAVGDGVATELNAIEVKTVNSFMGTVMRNNLLDRLTPAGQPGTPRYVLNVRLLERQAGSGVRVDASVTRFNYRLIARYQLTDQTNGKVIHSDSSESIVAYDVVDSQFATVISRKDAQERAAADVSDNIKISLALYFQRQENESEVDVSLAK